LTPLREASAAPVSEAAPAGTPGRPETDHDVPPSEGAGDLILPPGNARIAAWLDGVGRALAVTDLDGRGERLAVRLPLQPAD